MMDSINNFTDIIAATSLDINTIVVILGIVLIIIGIISLVLLSKLITLVNKKSEGFNNTIVGSENNVLVGDNNFEVPNRQEFIAALSAAIAEDMGTDISGLRILSVKKI